MLDAARELFIAQGYDATTTKDICARAGVAERLLFSNFGGKGGLFDAAVVTPFSELVAGYVSAWQEDPQHSTIEERVSSFVDGLFELARQNRTVLLALVTRRANNADPQAAALDHLAQTLQSMDAVDPALPNLDTPASIAAAAGMVFGVALLDDMLFPAGRRRPGRDRLKHEITQMILNGILHRG